MDRVLVTGLGAVTPVGLTARETWEALLAGRSGVAEISSFDASHLPVRIAGEVKGFEPTRYMDRKLARRMGRFAQFVIRDNSRVMFRWAPWFFNVQYFLLARFAPTRWLSMQLTRLIGSRAILKLVNSYRPDAVVSTYPGSTALIAWITLRSISFCRSLGMTRFPVASRMTSANAIPFNSWSSFNNQGIN